MLAACAAVDHLDIKFGSFLDFLVILQFRSKLSNTLFSKFALDKLAKFPVDFVDDGCKEGLQSYKFDFVGNDLRVQGPERCWSITNLRMGFKRTYN